MWADFRKNVLPNFQANYPDQVPVMWKRYADLSKQNWTRLRNRDKYTKNNSKAMWKEQVHKTRAQCKAEAAKTD